MDTMETNIRETEWVLCSSKHDDIIHIAPEVLNTILIVKLSRDIG